MTMSCFLIVSAISAACFAWYPSTSPWRNPPRLCLPEFLVDDSDEARAERLNLLLGGRPHIGRRDDGSKPPCGRDRLQAGTPTP